MTDNTTPEAAAPRKMHTASYFPLRDNYNEHRVELTTTSGATGLTLGLRRESYPGRSVSMTPDEARAIAADLIARADEIDAHVTDQAAAEALLDRVEADLE